MTSQPHLNGNYENKIFILESREKPTAPTWSFSCKAELSRTHSFTMGISKCFWNVIFKNEHILMPVLRFEIRTFFFSFTLYIFSKLAEDTEDINNDLFFKDSMLLEQN